MVLIMNFNKCQIVLNYCLACVFTFCASHSFAASGSTELKGSVSIARLYDSNVSLSEIDLTTRVGDHATVIAGQASIEHAFNQSFEGKFSLSLSDKSYDDATQFDLQTFIASGSLVKKLTKRKKLGILLNNANARLDGENYLNLTRISPNFSWNINKQNFVRLNLNYADKNFDNRPTRDATNTGFGADWFFFIDGARHFISSGYAFRQEDANDDAFDYQANIFKLNWVNKFEVFSLDSKFKVGVKLEDRDYDTLESGDGITPRSEERNRFFVEYELSVYDPVFIAFEYEYADFDSTEAFFTYDQNQITLTVGLDY